jgi:iron complex outermembrane receptor protein
VLIPKNTDSTTSILTVGGNGNTEMTDRDLPMVSRPVRWAVAVLLSGQLLSTATISAQDTTKVVRIRGLRVEVPRPTATTGGTSAVEVSLDSAGVVAAPTMEEFLRRIPTVQIRVNSRGEAQPDLRGAEDRQIAIFLDGIPLTVGWDHRTDMSVIPLTAVRKMTLYRGLSSMLHGPNVLGGAIEFDVGRGASLDTPVPPLLAALSVDQEGGIGTSATVGSRIQRSWVLRTGAGYRDSPGVTLPSGTRDDDRLRADFLADADGRRLNSDRRLIDGFVAARYDGSEGAWFSSLLTISDAERGVPPEAHVEDPRLWRYSGQSRLFTTLSGGSGMRETGLGEGEVEVSFGLDRSTTMKQVTETEGKKKANRSTE